MNDNVTEKEQLEMIRKWWNDWGKYLGLAILIGLIIGLGWRYWHKREAQRTQNASMIYSTMSNANLSKKPKEADQMANLLTKQYKTSPYAAFAAMLQAKQAVEEKNYKVATEKLQWVLTHSKMAILQQLSRLRIARIQLAQKQAKAALNTLKTVDDPAFQPMIDYVKSAAYQQLGDAKQAQQLLETAKNGLLQAGAMDPLIEMKLANGNHTN